MIRTVSSAPVRDGVRAGAPAGKETTSPSVQLRSPLQRPQRRRPAQHDEQLLVRVVGVERGTWRRPAARRTASAEALGARPRGRAANGASGTARGRSRRPTRGGGCSRSCGLPRRRVEAVADAVLGLDVGVRGAPVDLLAQLAHADVDRAVAGAVGDVPDALLQLVAVEHAPRLAREREQQPELRRRQLGVDALAAPRPAGTPRAAASGSISRPGDVDRLERLRRRVGRASGAAAPARGRRARACRTASRGSRRRRSRARAPCRARSCAPRRSGSASRCPRAAPPVVSAQPSTPGSIRSTTATSGCSKRSLRSALSPSSASTTSSPAASQMRRMTLLR